MENRPVIAFSAFSPAPGASVEDYERQLKWDRVVYPSVVMSIPQVIGLDYYYIIKQNLQYPDRVSISHYKNLGDWRESIASTQRTDLGNEFRSWIDRGVLDYIWSAAYSLMHSLRGKPIFSGKNEDTRINDAPIIHIEGYNLLPEEREKYIKWFGEYGSEMLLQYLRTLPGLAGYDLYHHTGLRMREFATELDYPELLSIIYFDNVQAHDYFFRSPELEGFYKAMRNALPRRLSYKWFVEYQMIDTHRK